MPREIMEVKTTGFVRRLLGTNRLYDVMKWDAVVEEYVHIPRADLERWLSDDVESRPMQPMAMLVEVEGPVFVRSTKTGRFVIPQAPFPHRNRRG